MTDKVTKLYAVNSLANDREELAKRIEEVAQRIRSEAGFADAARVVMIVEGRTLFATRVVGSACNNLELVGMLEIAKAMALEKC